MSNTTASGSFWQRAAAGWNDFFFRPGDPTTLGLMRLIVGVIVVYVHFAYTPDLIEFFGPKAWADLELINRHRKEAPLNLPSSDWDETRSNFDVPADYELRKVVLHWVQSLPKDVEGRRAILAFIGKLADINTKDAIEALAYAEQLLVRTEGDSPRVRRDQFIRVSPVEKAQRLDALTQKEIPDSEARIPRFMRKLPLSEREQYRRNVEAFINTLPTDSSAIALFFAHLQYEAYARLAVRDPNDPRSWLQHTYFFLTKHADPTSEFDRRQGPYLPDDLQERQEVLNYMDTWGVDKRRMSGQGTYVWSIWFHVTNPTAMYAIHFGFIGVMILFALGLWTRITSVATWMAALCYIHRSNSVLFGMDTMMNLCLLGMMIGPSGAALSLDRWLEKRRARRDLDLLRAQNKDTREVEAILAGPAPSAMATLATRLVQIHFCFIYAASGLSKLKGPAWWGHTAIWTTIANPEFSPTIYAPYRWVLLQLSDHRWLCELVMSGGAVFTLFLEIGVPFLIWRPTLRPYLIILAVLLHTGIAVFMGLTVFGLLMMVMLLAFVPPAAVIRWLAQGEERVRSVSSGVASRQRVPVS